ncbi:hypothetical protein ACFL3T_02740 [Patescibacteria group bacterium]
MNETTPEKASPAAKPAQKPLSIESKFRHIKENLKYIFYPLTKKETKLFKPMLDKLKNNKILSETQAKKILADLQKPPYSFFTRSSAIRELIIGQIIDRLNKSASKEFKDKLLKHFESATSTTDSTLEDVKQTMKKYGLTAGLKAITSKSKVTGDPLFNSPIGIPLDKKFYEGRNDKAVLPVGERYAKHIPEFFWNEIKDGDPIKMFVFQSMSHYYKFTVNFYNDIKSDTVKSLMYYGFVKPMQLAMQGILKIMSASNLQKAADVGKFVSKYLGKFVKTISSLMSKGNKILQKSGASFEIKHIFSTLTTAMQSLTKDIGKMTSLLRIVSGVLGIAKRNPTSARQYRIKNRANSFLQNKLFLIVLLEHKGANRIDRYYIQLVARIIANFRGDDDLRKHFKALKPNIMHLLMSPGRGQRFLKSIDQTLYKRYKVTSNLAKRREIIETALDLLLPVKILNQKEKKSPENKRLQALHKLFTYSFAAVTRGTSFNKERSQQLLSITLLLDNVRVYVVKKDLVKANKILNLLVSGIKIFNKMLSTKEKKIIAENYPELADFLNHPDKVKKLIDAIRNPKQAAKDSIVLAKKIKDLLGVKRKAERDKHIKKIQKFVAELNIVKSRLKRNKHYRRVTARLSRLRKKYDSLEKSYSSLDKELKKLYAQYGKIRTQFGTLNSKIKLEKNPKNIAELKKTAIALMRQGKKIEKQIAVVHVKIKKISKQLSPLDKAVRVASIALQRVTAPLRKVQGKISYASHELAKVHKELQQMKALQALMEATGTKEAVAKLLTYTKRLLLKDIPKQIRAKAKTGVLREVYSGANVPPLLAKANKMCDYIITKSNLAPIFGKKAPAKSLLFRLLVLNRVKAENPNPAKLKQIIFESIITSLQTTKYIAYLKRTAKASLSEAQRKKNIKRLKFHINKAVSSIA